MDPENSKKADFPPDTTSVVEVTYADGRVNEYPISASPRIATYLARRMEEQGALVLFTTTTSQTILREHIIEFSIRSYEKEAL